MSCFQFCLCSQYAKPVDYTQTWDQVFKQLRTYGFAVVEIYGGEFLNWNGMKNR